jgi:hypothetical protein
MSAAEKQKTLIFKSEPAHGPLSPVTSTALAYFSFEL